MCFYSCPAGNPGGTAEHSGGSTVGELQAETSRLTADLILLHEGVDRRPGAATKPCDANLSVSRLSWRALLLRSNDKRSRPRHVFT